MKGRLRVLFLLCGAMLAALSGAAFADEAATNAAPPSREQVLRLMSAMGLQQNVDTSLLSAKAKVKEAAVASFKQKHPDADEATMKKLDDVFDSTKFFTFADVAEAVIPIYQKNLSAGDVQAGIDFYSSQAGKRLLEKVPEILHEASQTGGALVEQKLDAYTAELQSKLEDFQNQMNPSQTPAAPSKDSSKTDHKSE